MRLDWTRWAFYLAVGPPFLLTLFMIRSRWLKTVVLLFMLVFVEAVLLTWRPIGYIAFSLTGAMAYVIAASLLTQPEARRSMLALGLPWILFISSALVAVLIGSTSRVSDAATNWLYFQQFYLEGLLFFWIGRTAVRDGLECEKAAALADLLRRGRGDPSLLQRRDGIHLLCERQHGGAHRRSGVLAIRGRLREPELARRLLRASFSRWR